MKITVKRTADLPDCDLAPLLADSHRENSRIVQRLIEDWQSGKNRFDKDGEALFIAVDDGCIVGVCGVNVDPFAGNPRIGRVRRLYVMASERRKGIGSSLVRRVMEEARKRFTRLHVRTNTETADGFYRALGFSPCPGHPDYTHSFDLWGDSKPKPSLK